jgi:hypothetical protein
MNLARLALVLFALSLTTGCHKPAAQSQPPPAPAPHVLGMVPAVYTWSSNVGVVSGTLKTSGGRLYSYRAENRNAAARWLQLWDTAGSPGTGTLIDAVWIPASGGYVQDAVFYENGLTFSSGITWGFSTTSSTYSAATAADHTFAADYN